MAEYIEINGGVPLAGSVQVSGAKNAALPMMMATLLTTEYVDFENVPNLEDVNLTITLLEQLGASIDFSGDRLRICVPRLLAREASYSLVKALRASFWVLAPLLARGGAARVALPGGDIIGARPVDMHLSALGQMGADLKVKHGVVYATAVKGLRPARIEFRFPSVGATHQVMMAAALTPGTTVIQGAAREPEVVALAHLLCQMGADIEGAGGPVIAIHGQSELHGTSVRVIGDRIEAGTYLLAGLATGGLVTVTGIDPAFLGQFMEVLSRLGAEVSSGDNFVSVRSRGRLHALDVATAPFPGVASDLQAPLMAALALAEGESHIEEGVFEGRFGHVAELCRMGASIAVSEKTATVTGVGRLTGAPVEGHDIRAAAALVIAALASEGVTQLYEPQHLRRGYERLEVKLTALGARVGRKMSDPEDFIFAGC